MSKKTPPPPKPSRPSTPSPKAKPPSGPAPGGRPSKPKTNRGCASLLGMVLVVVLIALCIGGAS